MTIKNKYFWRRLVAGGILYALLCVFCVWATTDGYELIQDAKEWVANNV